MLLKLWLVFNFQQSSIYISFFTKIQKYHLQQEKIITIQIPFVCVSDKRYNLNCTWNLNAHPFNTNQVQFCQYMNLKRRMLLNRCFRVVTQCLCCIQIEYLVQKLHRFCNKRMKIATMEDIVNKGKDKRNTINCNMNSLCQQYLGARQRCNFFLLQMCLLNNALLISDIKWVAIVRLTVLNEAFIHSKSVTEWISQ